MDLWGKYRTATRAAQNDLLATQYARETVRTVVAAEVARTYFSLLAADAQLKLLQDTLSLREQTVTLQTDRAQAGVIGDYDLSQAKAERAAVAADIAAAQARRHANSNRRWRCSPDARRATCSCRWSRVATRSPTC